MTTAPSDGRLTLSEYQLRLPTYEGPLDILLRLIERSQLAIEDVSLVAVTHQFLAFVEGLVEASPDVVAEFTAVGARLTVLKSRSLLPRPPATEDEIPESDLSRQLREYQRIKQLAAHLQGVHALGNASYSGLVRGAVTHPTASTTVRLAHGDASSLLQALRRRLSAVPRPATIVQQRPIVSLRELVTHVSACVDRLHRVQFSAVIHEYRSRPEVATAFLAVLVLVRRQAIAASQGDVFSDIELSQHLQPVAPNGNDRHDDEGLFRYAVNNDR
jgi:segregation and condensation protein A